MYSNEPKGTVHSASEYISAEEEHSPSSELLNLVTTPLYAGQIFFFGTTRTEELR